MAERVTAIAVNGKVSKFIDMGNNLQLINYIYPVGSIFSSVDPNMDPNTRYVGTEWNKLEDGYFLEATTTTSSVNTKVQAGLPNLTGQQGHIVTHLANNSVSTGVFAKSTWITSSNASGGSGGGFKQLNFDASSSNAIYGRSTTVQPKALRVAMWIRIK